MILPALSTLGQANLFCDLGIKNGNNLAPGLSIFVACKANNYHNIFLELLEQQRQLLDKINHRAEFDEDLIRKYHALIDLEEFKTRERLPLNGKAD